MLVNKTFGRVESVVDENPLYTIITAISLPSTFSDSTLDKTAIFSGWKNLTAIYYAGTRESWKVADANSNFFDSALSQTIAVACSDGTLIYQNGALVAPTGYTVTMTLGPGEVEDPYKGTIYYSLDDGATWVNVPAGNQGDTITLTEVEQIKFKKEGNGFDYVSSSILGFDVSEGGQVSENFILTQDVTDVWVSCYD